MKDKEKTRLMKALNAFRAGVDVAMDMVTSNEPAKDVHAHLQELGTELTFITEHVDKHIGAREVLKRTHPRAENPT